ncbi:MAG: hypothetical protein NTY34_02370 [Candidatus Omnitrophica bacterium]|nr:hypothetical protein [Candidatus Omnitrophota bacterium]
MQNKYTGDVGDFGKYGLLKELISPKIRDNYRNFKLGMVWYLVPDEQKNSDGKHIAYLNQAGEKEKVFRDCDPDLYDKLSVIVKTERAVKRITAHNVLPFGTVFYEDVLTFDGLPNIGPAAHAERLGHRNKWGEKAFNKMKECDVVFFDPDNGFEVKSFKKLSKKGPKYIFFNEITPYWEKHGQSLVVYQHINRNEKVEKQVEKRFSQLKKHLKFLRGAFALLYHRGTARAFLVLPASAEHKKILFDRANSFIKTPWGEHFDRRIIKM